jgi:hypothetical protein
MPKYEVLIKAFASVIVDAPDEESAMDAARDEVDCAEWEIDEVNIEDHFKTDADAERALPMATVRRIIKVEE